MTFDALPYILVAGAAAAIVAYLDGLSVGQDVTPGGIMFAAKTAVNEVAEFSTLFIGTDGPPPTTTGTFSISLRQVVAAGTVTVA